MAKNLVIVESPAKAKTIKKFLGSNYKVEASMGHVRDLPKSQLGVDIENDFEPKYITIRGKGELLKHLRKEVKKANKVFLATDPDREGEAISWHLLFSLNLQDKKFYRITFNEITKNAVKNSIKQAREIDMDLVDAQQARRILDRIVGYKISPLLWKKIKKGLSAGRVQSTALKLICDREEEINNFIPEEYWSLEAKLKDDKSKDEFIATFYGKDKKMKITSKEQVDTIVDYLKDKDYIVNDVKESIRQKKPLQPFITSTLQQEAAKKLNFTTAKTMRFAQQLYEGVDVKGKGTIGLITYLRTDSTRISDDADKAVKEHIKSSFGEEYVNNIKIVSNKKTNVQDAHEAIRPSYIDIHPDEIKDSLSRDQLRLYKLIYNRFVASRMKPAKYATKSIKISGGDYRFNASGSVLIFDGFLKVYNILDETEDNQKIGNINKDSNLSLIELNSKQHFTQPAPRYTEASLVKTLEENGVGRPSTYAPTISTIQKRGYVSKEKKNIFPTELGEIVNDIMEKYFENIVNVKFTAALEKELDEVETGNIPWKEVLRNFYPDFGNTIEYAEEKIGKIEIKDEVSDVLCDKCGRNMVIKIGRYGKFLACPGFPECRNAKPLYEKVEGVACPKCSGEIFIKKTKKGRRYYGCENNPKCDFMTWNKPTKEICPKCGTIMVEKGKYLKCNNEECNYSILKENVTND
ncbi:DNA topoisomerase 1 [Vallitalea longa]|uniref:DNA topoisomerase 1 n=1 Tax=Vallitalea longa TaxID=2936439 RepID=A0A9W6DE17_9FIRM|nr:type I DNA topoisomerase [Vallitalea longa]GKX28995.1 DNA topoisomerase 1 [Vallitalea longa]